MERGLIKRSHKEALRGFIACAAGTVTIFAAMYFGAPIQAQQHVPGIVETFGDTEEQALAFLVESARYTAGGFLKLLLPMFAIYWLFAGLWGRTPILKSRSANFFLMIGCIGVTAVAANHYFYWAETYCDVLPFPHEGFQILRIYECPSSQIFFTSLFWVSIALFVVSLIVRLARTGRSTPAIG